MLSFCAILDTHGTIEAALEAGQRGGCCYAAQFRWEARMGSAGCARGGQGGRETSPRAECDSNLTKPLPSASDLFFRRAAVDSNPLPDQTVLLFQKDTSIAVPVNQAGAAIWEMCDGAHTLDQMVDELAEIYDQERSRIEQDARVFLDELIRLGLVDRQPATR